MQLLDLAIMPGDEIMTLLINYYHQQVHPGVGFNYAYIPGIAMLVVLSASFVMFTKDRLKDS